ncbi:type II secretion system protein GspL [Sphingomonas sp.]|uniref:type II secretion system protein GspL n=1 Tax=Sphingomonas sp. TaxID=28214 RepID=UPI002C28BE39|nr:type II secretion system protein GspL [Sphingomonas sp.]HWK35534.1 type II secretion system protein GspL [Sphingomonas sp.]
MGNASAPIAARSGVWRLDGEKPVPVTADGPATLLVPTEAVRLIAADLPIASRAKRLAALPFAVEDLIAEPVESVHLALGAEIAPKRYLVGVVGRVRMAAWVAAADAAGLGAAALVPDALALPLPDAGGWAVGLEPARAVVRSADGTGFAIPAAMLRTAWEGAGRPPATGYGDALPEEMGAAGADLGADSVAERLRAPALDLRQGDYAVRRRRVPGVGRRLALIVGLGVLAHTGIAAADTLMLRRIADTRADDLRTLVATKAPGANLSGDDLAGTVADLIPRAAAGGDNPFLPLATRVSTALAPMAGSVPVKTMRFSGGVLTIAVDSSDPALAARINAALREGGVDATVAARGDGITITLGTAA